MKKKKSIHSIKVRISVSVLAVSILYSVILGSFSLISYENNLKKYMAMRALDIVQTVSINIDGDKIAQYDQTGQKDAYFQEMEDYLCEVKQNVNVTY